MNLYVSKIFNSSTKVPITVGIGSFILGAATSYGVSYILNRKKEQLSIHSEPDPIVFPTVEMEQVIQNRRLDELNQPNDISEEVSHDHTEEIAAAVGKDFVEKKLEETVTTITPEPEVEPEEPVNRSVFAGSNDEWDYEKEQESRSSSEPYVIHTDEFHADELDYTQNTLTYYVGDDILVDEQDSPIYNHYMTVGPLKFGHGSQDPNVVYIRSDKLKAEYEIILDPGLYSVEVLGLEIENNSRVQDLKHSRHHVPRFHQE